MFDGVPFGITSFYVVKVPILTTQLEQLSNKQSLKRLGFKLSLPSSFALHSSKGTFEWHYESEKISVPAADINCHFITSFTLS